MPLYLETWKYLEFDNLCKKKKKEKPGIRQTLKKTWNFKQISLKNLEKPGIFNKFYMFSSKISL